MSMIRLLRNLLTKIRNLINLFDIFKWMIRQYFEPRAVGTRFTKKQGKFIVTYEIIGYMPGKFPKEILDEVSRVHISA